LASERFGLGKGWSKPSSPQARRRKPRQSSYGAFSSQKTHEAKFTGPSPPRLRAASRRRDRVRKTRKLFRCPGLSGTKVPLAALRLAHTRGCTSPCATQTATRMKTALLVLFFVATASPVLANSEITCETVRAYVRQVGFVQAKAQARAAGMTATQERRASRCFTKTD